MPDRCELRAAGAGSGERFDLRDRQRLEQSAIRGAERHRLLIRAAAPLLAIALWAIAPAAHGWAGTPDGAAVDVGGAAAIYVNPNDPAANDANSGARAQPLRTLAAAVAIATRNRRGGTASRIELAPAVYRESVAITGGGASAPAIVIEASGGAATLSGADVWRGWSRVKPGVWSHRWPYEWGLAPIPRGWESQNLQPIVRRREMVVVNGRVLTQTTAPGAMQDRAGTFYVDDFGQTIYLHPPAGIDPDAATIEVATRPTLMRLGNAANVVLRGLTFEYASSPLQEAALAIDNSNNIEIDRCAFIWNSWLGVTVGATSNLTIAASRANHNGGAGFTLWRVGNLRLVDSRASYNNWRGAAGGFLGWAVAGIKSLEVSDALYRGLVANGNQTRGAWFDTDCRGVTIDRATLCRNQTDGVFIEANPGPFTIQNSVLCDNRGAGVLSGNSSDVMLRGNVLYGNAKAQILISGFHDGARPMKQWRGGRTIMLKSTDWTVAKNVIAAHGASQMLVGTTLGAATWNDFITSLVSGDNLWFNGANPNAFQVAGGARLDFAGWRRATNQERGSTFADPRLRAPQAGDFRPAAGAPIDGAALPLVPPPAAGD